jgi:hypothetical protein
MLPESTIRQRIVTLLRLYAVILTVGSCNPGYNSNLKQIPTHSRRDVGYLPGTDPDRVRLIFFY